MAMTHWQSDTELFELKASGENLVRKEIENGMSSTAAFERYGIL
jgi:hypothetical protein